MAENRYGLAMEYRNAGEVTSRKGDRKTRDELQAALDLLG
jgi:hypothetical protein